MCTNVLQSSDHVRYENIEELFNYCFIILFEQ